jgi:hypothetical protein
MQKRYSRTVAAFAAVLLLTGLTGCSLFPNPTSTALSTPPDVDKGTDAPQPPEPTAEPEPVIVIAELDGDRAHVSVSGYVAGVIENGGVCRWTLSNGAAQQQLEAEGLADRAQTSCGVSQFDTAQLTPGTWSVTLEYSSDTQSSIISKPNTLEIP